MKKILPFLLASVLACPSQAELLYSPGASSSGGSVTVPHGAYASKPAASAGLEYFATDIGNHGCLLVSDGTVWKPASGRCTIYQHGEGTSSTSSTTEANLAIAPIPAGLLSSEGALSITATITATGSSGTRSPTIRFSGTSGDTTGGTQVYGGSNLSATQASGMIIKTVWNRNSASIQVTGQTGNGGVGISSAGIITPAINTANASYLNFNGFVASASDSMAWSAITVEWID
jgi:hypothetical protein